MYAFGRGSQASLQQDLITAKNLRFLYPTGLPKSVGKKTSAVTTNLTNGGVRRDPAEYGMTYQSPAKPERLASNALSLVPLDDNTFSVRHI